MQALKVENIDMEFGGVHALTGVSFNVDVGERLAIIGPNGAGKTTLFNVLNGQLRASSGIVTFFGEEITNLPTHKRAHLGMSRSFQLTTIFPDLTVLENILLAHQGIAGTRFHAYRSIHAFEKINIQAKNLLETIGLWDKRFEPAGAIAYGEQRKLEIALSLASNPKLLLLDEPNCGLTTDESREIISQINNMREDITILIVAHDMDLVFGVADRVIVLHYGAIISEGTCDDIKCDIRVKEVYMGAQEIA